MSESGTQGLFPMDDGQSPGNVIKYRETGIIPFQGIKALVAKR